MIYEGRQFGPITQLGPYSTRYHGTITTHLCCVRSVILALRVVVAGATAEQPVRDEAAPVATAATHPGDGQAVDAGEELGARDVLGEQTVNWGKQSAEKVNKQQLTL